MDEHKLYCKVMGIEEARKLHVPMPNGIKIPKNARLSSSGGFCGNCGQHTLEGHEDGNGMWHYRCPYCIQYQDPNDESCPRCECKAHQNLCGNIDSLNNPFKPIIEECQCLNCGYKWVTQEFVKYLLTKVVKSVSPTSGFAKKD